MLNVFALDPEIIRDTGQFRYCTEHCHPSKGRLIADLPPGSWPVRIYEIIKELRLRTKEEAKLKRWAQKVVKDQLIDRPKTYWDYLESSWIKNAENEHQREPFSLIVSPHYHRANDEDQKYPPDELDSDVSAWNTPTGVQIERSPIEFVKAILPMLQLAKEIHFVDRFFNVEANSLYTQNYKQIIADLAEYHNSSSSFPSLVIHCCPDANNVPTRAHFENGLENHYAPLIPRGKSIKTILWEVESTERGAHYFHNRYVLCNHFGVMVGYGTDSARQRTDARDTLQILDESSYKNLWSIRGKWLGARIKEEFTIPVK